MQINLTTYTSNRLATLKKRYNFKTKEEVVKELLLFRETTRPDFPHLLPLFTRYAVLRHPWDFTNINVSRETAMLLKQLRRTEPIYTEISSYEDTVSALLNYHKIIRNGLKSSYGFHNYPLQE